MLRKKIIIGLFPAFIFIYFIIPGSLFSADLDENKTGSTIPYKIIELTALSRIYEDRIAFQHIQLPGFNKHEDNSIASLLVIKNNEIFLFRDGYDDPKKVLFEAYLQTVRMEVPKDLWVNKINSKPDYLRIASKRVEKFLDSREEYTEKNSGEVYRSIRDSFLNYHIKIFKELIVNRVDSDCKIERNPIYPPAFKEMNAKIVFTTTIKARALNDYIYYAEDKDGDEVTETFYVTMPDSFNWGFKSGPNVIFIYNNKEEDIKQLIGKLCYEAYFGKFEEEGASSKIFPKDTDILKSFNIEKVKMQTPPPQAQPARQASPATPAQQK
jgi:hypothetical protein